MDVLCRRIQAGSVDLIDLAELPALAGGFHGGALVSATAWHHPLGGAGNGPERNLVGLAAVAITRGTDADRDELAMVEGVPLAHVPPIIGADAIARCAPQGGPTPAPTGVTTTATATATATAIPSAASTGTPTPTRSTPATPVAATATASPTLEPESTVVPTATWAVDGVGTVYLPIGWTP